jgi:DNA-binding NarL/FixJ family response regulator
MLRIALADDAVLLREGLVVVLARFGHEVVAAVGDATALTAAVAADRPDVVVTDVRMPPSFTDEGLRAAHQIRARHPRMGIVILSQHVESGIAMRLLAESPERLGYLLKDRVGDIGEFAAVLRHVAVGGAALDPQVVSRLLAASKVAPLQALSPRERDVLALVAEGRSNRAIAERLDITERGVQKHVTSIFAKLGLPADEDDNRRILAVLEYLRPS